MWCWRVMMVFPKCWITSVYTARTGSLFLVIFSSLALCRFVEGDWCFFSPPCGHLLWKAGTPRPRQHNQCSSWLRGWGGGLCGLFYLISVSTRASVWCKRVGVSLLPAPTPPPPYLFSLLVSHLDVCDPPLQHPTLVLFSPGCANLQG